MPTWIQYKSEYEATNKEKHLVPKDWPKVVTNEWLGRMVKELVKAKRLNAARSLASFALYSSMGRPTLFCGSRALAECLENTKLEIDTEIILKRSPFIKRLDEPNVNLPFASFGVYSTSWPDTYEWEGENLKPVFISTMGDRISLFTRREFGEGCTISGKSLAELYNELEMVRSEFKYPHTMLDLKSMLMSLQLSMISILCPNQVVDDLPEGMKPRDRKNTSSRDHVSIDIPIEHRNSPLVHFRNCHFRTLNHERYKRGANGLPRVVFVNSSIVGRAKTVKEKV